MSCRQPNLCCCQTHLVCKSACAALWWSIQPAQMNLSCKCHQERPMPAATKMLTPLGHLDLCGHSQLALVLCDLDAVSKDACSMATQCQDHLWQASCCRWVLTATAMARVWPRLPGLRPRQDLTPACPHAPSKLTCSIVDRRTIRLFGLYKQQPQRLIDWPLPPGMLSFAALPP